MKLKLYIQAEKYSYEDKLKVRVNTFEVRPYGENIAFTLGTAEVEIDMPEYSHEQLTQMHIEQLEGIKSKIQAECNAKVVSIDNEIGKLLALPQGSEK